MNIFQAVNDRADASRASHQQRMTQAAIAHYASHPELAPSEAVVKRRVAPDWWAFSRLWEDTLIPEGRLDGRPLYRSAEKTALKYLGIAAIGGLTYEGLTIIVPAGRWCYSCQKFHPASAFAPDFRNPDGLAHYCTSAPVTTCVCCGKLMMLSGQQERGRDYICTPCYKGMTPDSIEKRLIYDSTYVTPRRVGRPAIDWSQRQAAAR